MKLPLHPAKLLLSFVLAISMLSCQKTDPPLYTSINTRRDVCWAAIEGVEGGLLVRSMILPDGSATQDTLYTSADGLKMPWAIAIDRQRNFIYWINDNTEVKRAALDGSGNITTVYSAAQGLHWAQEMTLDLSENKLYLADYTDVGGIIHENIMVGDLNTPGPLDTVYSLPYRAVITDIKIDENSSNIYWVEAETGRVKQGNTAGTQPPAVLFETGDNGLRIPQKIAPDPVHGKIYIADHQVSQNGAIYMGNIDGSGSLTKLLEESSPQPPATSPVLELEADLEFGYIYWMNGNSSADIRRMKLDGTDVETVYTGIISGYFFAVDQ